MSNKNKYKWNCPNCNGDVDACDKYCKHCGYSFIKKMQEEIDKTRIWKQTSPVPTPRLPRDTKAAEDLFEPTRSIHSPELKRALLRFAKSVGIEL